MQTKAQLISGILHINRSARQDWLDRFEESALRNYLDHLHHALEPRGRDSIWLRDTGSPAAVSNG